MGGSAHCGDLVLRVRVGQMWGPNLTVCGQSMRKSLIQRQSWLLRLRASIFVTVPAGDDGVEGRAVVNKKHQWRAAFMASSVDLLALYAY